MKIEHTTAVTITGGQAMTRRDLCYLVGRRAARLSFTQSAKAWQSLARSLEGLSDKDIPKFHDVMDAVRVATIVARQPVKPTRSPSDWIEVDGAALFKAIENAKQEE